MGLVADVDLEGIAPVPDDQILGRRYVGLSQGASE
jgi:hypothetical protein